MLKSLKSSDFSHSNQVIPEKYTDRAEIGLHEHQEPQEQHPKEDFIKKEIYDFPKVIVKDLILNFENHINGFVQPNDIVKCDKKEKENMLKSKSIQHSRSSETLQTDQFQICNEIKIDKLYQEPTDSYEELYVPKDIPLESYAPPPTSSPIKTNYNHEWKPSTNFLGSQFSELSRNNEPTHSQNVCNLPTYSPLISNIPKEQSCVQNNCMTAPQNIRQVNFSPSPLPYDKLAKFDSPTSPPSFNNNYTGNRLSRSNLTIGSSAVRNISPKPFGHVASGTISPKLGAPLSPNYSTPVTATPVNQYYNTSGRSTSQNISSSNILHGSNFNNSAQGWQKKAPTAVSHAPLNTQLHVGGNLPYTDF
ncbi:uncharacterized protein LOC119684979 [Teleopsis dalmanni]|nr:uncharacterized protein LOC119684979 [Teleopsis dalmanni]